MELPKGLIEPFKDYVRKLVGELNVDRGYGERVMVMYGGLGLA